MNAKTMSRRGVRSASPFTKERIEVRDSSGSVLPRQSKSPEERYQVLRGPDDSKNERRQFRLHSRIALGLDLAPRLIDSHGQNHPTQSQVLGPDSRNPTRSDQLGAAAEIYVLRSYDFEDGAIGCVRSRSRFFEDSRRASQRGVELSREIDRLPLTLILSPQAGRGGSGSLHTQ